MLLLEHNTEKGTWESAIIQDPACIVLTQTYDCLCRGDRWSCERSKICFVNNKIIRICTSFIPLGMHFWHASYRQVNFLMWNVQKKTSCNDVSGKILYLSESCEIFRFDINCEIFLFRFWQNDINLTVNIILMTKNHFVYKKTGNNRNLYQSSISQVPFCCSMGLSRYNSWKHWQRTVLYAISFLWSLFVYVLESLMSFLVFYYS